MAMLKNDVFTSITTKEQSNFMQELETYMEDIATQHKEKENSPFVKCIMRDKETELAIASKGK